ncbi:MAG: AMP-binding protein, partial [Alphaproteobacteria bacterium]
TQAAADDVHLSVMPLPLLLETISAVMVPLLVGASVRLEQALAEGGVAGKSAGIAEAFGRTAPTTSVLLPQHLAAWVGQLTASARRAPKGLRFIAVGGARLSPVLAARAWRLGIPVYEGYGLSECAAFVAVNRPDARKPGTVGKPLGGLSVHIDEGEIVVQGPSVMAGYLRGKPAGGRWRTGDLGAIDRDGFLSVHGRRDNLLVTALGCRISPEWLETLLADDPRIGKAIVAGEGRRHLSALLVPSAAGEAWFARARAGEIAALIARLCRAAPAHAVPRGFLVVTGAKLKRLGLLTGSGLLRRAAALDFFTYEIERLYAPAAFHASLEASP